MRTSKGCLFIACYSKGAIHHRLHLAETQRQAGEFIVGKSGGFIYVQLTRNLEAGYLEAGPPM